MTKKILIVSYTFPPYPGIGGRRWAKFAKYLAQKGYEIHVVCSENPFDEQSSWLQDIQYPSIKVYPLPVKYPMVMLLGVNNLFDKLIYRFWKIYFSFYSKGVIYERTIFWKKQLLEKASELIEKERIKNVIVSIPPYRLAVYTTELKRKFPYINFIVDYRDPWTDNKSFHGFKDITSARFKYEEGMEKEVINSADYIITVSEKMTDNIKARNTTHAKIITVTNGYDPADILPVVDKKTWGDNKIRFIYAGTLYSNLNYIISPLLDYLEKLKNTNKPLYDQLSFEFYGKQNPELAGQIIRFKSPAISIHDTLPLGQMQEKIRNGNFCTLMSAPDHSFAFNTKFVEYVANRKPILLFSYPGETSDFLRKNKLGFHINPPDIENNLNEFFAGMPGVIENFNSKYNIEPFSIPFLTTKIEAILK